MLIATAHNNGVRTEALVTAMDAPLGRAVIGGLAFATITTLFVVPIIYSYLRVKPPVDYENQLLEADTEPRV